MIDNSIVRQHSLYKRFGKKLNDISERDYNKRYFDNNIQCLDIDSYNSSLHSAQQGHTMDAAIGIANNNKGEKKNLSLMLVELRINCKSPKQFDASLLAAKLSYTKQLLGNELPIHPYSYFVYNKNFFETIQTRFRSLRQGNKALSHAILIDVDEFNHITAL